MAFRRDAEMQFQRQFYKLIPHSVILCEIGPKWVIYWEVRNGVQIWKMARAISGRLHLHTLVVAKLCLQLNPSFPGPPCQRFVTVGQQSEGLGKPWGGRQNLCTRICGHVGESTCAVSAGEKSSPLSDSASGARLPGRKFSPIQKEGVSGRGYSSFSRDDRVTPGKKSMTFAQVTLQRGSLWIPGRLWEGKSQHEGAWSCRSGDWLTVKWI